MAWTFADDFVTAYNFGITDSRGYGIRRNATSGGTNYGNTAAFDYFSDTASADDYLYIACGTRYWGVKFNVGTAFVADSVEFAWEWYNRETSSWLSLAVTNPNALLSTGEQIVSFTPPPNWGAVGNEMGGWAIRCRIVSVTNISEGGANSTYVPRFNFKSLMATGTETSLSSAYTADLAGTYELLSATPAASLTPLEMPTNEIIESAKIDVILSGTTAGAGDTVVLTGTDVEGNAQTETFDVSTGDGTYTTTKFFRNLTLVECNGFSEGTITVTQKRWGIISQKINQYVLKTHLLIGDGSTATTLTLTALHISFCPGMFWRVYNNATFLSGSTTGEGTDQEGSYGGCSFWESINSRMGMGSYWKRLWIGATVTLRGCNFYLSSAYNPTRVYWFNAGTLTLQDCHFRGTPGASNEWSIYGISPQLKRVYVSGYVPGIRRSYTAFTGLKTDVRVSFELDGFSTLTTLDGCSIAGARMWPYRNSRLDLVDCPGMSRDSFTIGHNTNDNDDCVFIQYRLDLKVQDKEATPLENANVVITDVNGTVVFSGQTDASGNIAQQILTYDKADWIGSPMGYSWEYRTPHTITISKPGYQTKTLKLTMNKKREEVEVLEKEVPIFIGKGKVLVNVDPKNNQNNILI